ncbi:nucleotidyltransferase domain-containing protein [Clostridium sp. KNHs214]|uniref:nucleotidyltransferase family protein n=1 Tax=Clostridium sp. KNHs214 TaxID=1540257 RepID=UPI00055054AB|nr:nucleotidyltransferase domain-containing protein [Clostridium sp. KNHs214]
MNEKIIIEKEVTKYNVDVVGIFGSRARGDYNEYSDYDIFVIGNLTLEEELELEEDLKNKLNCEVDLVKITKDTNRILLKNIANEAMVIYSRNDAYEKFYSFIENFFRENSDFIRLRERDLFD